MDLNKYQELAKRTIPTEFEEDELLINAVLGLCGESGEVADLLKKSIFQGHELNEEKIIDELGDVLWYIAEAATALGIDLEQVAEHNISKLKKRYPNGFESHKSINRLIEVCEFCRYQVCSCNADIADVEYGTGGLIINCKEFSRNE